MNQIEIFNSPEFGSIRTLEQNGKVLFCGTDVATALGYTNPRKAVRDHTRGGTKCSIGVQTGKKADGSPAVQMVEMLFIPEGDLYRLIAHSKLPSAERFEQWVFDEVLPAIRKHGAYQAAPQLSYDIYFILEQRLVLWFLLGTRSQSSHIQHIKDCDPPAFLAL